MSHYADEIPFPGAEDFSLHLEEKLFFLEAGAAAGFHRLPGDGKKT